MNFCEPYPDDYISDVDYLYRDSLPADHIISSSGSPSPGLAAYFDGFTDEVLNSSPSPPERTRTFNQPKSDTSCSNYRYDNPVEIYGKERLVSAELDTQRPHSYGSSDTFCSSPAVVPFHPSSYSSSNWNQTNLHFSPSAKSLQYQNEKHEETFDTRGSNSKNKLVIRLRPVSDLPDMFRAIFKFGVFNAVQSSCFETIISSSDNVVISAPTGSGKTVIFELAIIRLQMQARDPGQSMKCVYIAPTKALCSERFRDWSAKFDPLGIKCCELTGDTVHFGTSDWGNAKTASIIITTGEKWDSLTRNWKDQGQILSKIHLFLVDEVHILNDFRGSTLEVVISRMKKRGSAVRFVLVSATIPNIADISAWIGSSEDFNKPAKVFEFGEEFRPCKLTRHVIGFPRQNGQSDFVFAKNLDYKLFPVLQQYSIGKPILVFCSSRKGVFCTAEQLMKDYSEKEKANAKLPWSRPASIGSSFNNKRLSEFASFGIGVHHAGLSMEDRITTENLYLKKFLRILIATSTLAVGVNLPAHMVVIKGVHGFQNNSSVEYSDLDILQMLGRAGRPQFDKDGIAVILCEKKLENKYKALAEGKTILESSLHTNLSEHLNTEIGLGTIDSVDSAKEWLQSSFLFQRIRKNPNHYSLGKEDTQTWQDRIDIVVNQSLEKLKDLQLVKGGDQPDSLQSTEYGDIMSKFYIRQSSMALILAIPEQATMKEILEIISACEEVSESKLRASEKTVYNQLRKHNDIRFEILKVEKTCDKVFLLIQAVLGGISLNAPEYKCGDSQPYLEAFGIFKHIPRISRAVVEVAIIKKRGAQVKHGLEIVRCLTAKAWEDRPTVLRQLEHLGEKSIKVLAEHGITSLDVLRKESPLRIEALLNRRPPFGLDVLFSLNEFPQYSLELREASLSSSSGTRPVEVELSIECGLLDGSFVAPKFKKQKTRYTNMTTVLTLTSDLNLIDFRRIPTKALKTVKTFEVTAQLSKPSQSVMVIISSENIAGVSVQKIYKPAISPKEYSTMDTRPLSSVEMDLTDLDDDPDFWNMEIDDIGEKSQSIRGEMKANNAERQDCIVEHHDDKKKLLSARPRNLPNGNYECNHHCKDKTKCRHLCCRDGLTNLPQGSRKVNVIANKQQTKLSSASTFMQNSTKIDRRLGYLESIHENALVSKGLNLPKGQRLTKDPPRDLRGNRPRQKPDFTIKLSDLKDETHQSVHSELPDVNDDDDLPEADTLLQPCSETSAESSLKHSQPSFSNSSEKARAKPLFVKTPLRPKQQFPVTYKKDLSISPPAKRLKRDHNIDDPLFLVSGNEDSGQEDEATHEPYTKHDEFSFDSGCFDVLPVTPPTTIPNDSNSSKSQTLLASSQEERTLEEEERIDGDELAELDAWLNSGSVEVI